jgi:general nucleoside transport system ATP-binding protein
MPAPVLELRNLGKSYGAVRAVEALDLSIAPGEVVGLVGENGAGKSTVVNMVSGMTRPSTGLIRLRGEAVQLSSARDARAHGIGVVHQHYALVPSFTVAESFALGEEAAGPINRARLSARVRALADDIGMTIAPDARIGSLDVAGQQRVEILRALSRKIDLLILDEPTAVLTAEDAEKLFAVIERLRLRGVAVLLITHKLADVARICDRAAVMHAGRLVADRPVSQCTPEMIVSLMISGREDDASIAEMAGTLSDDFPEYAGTNTFGPTEAETPAPIDTPAVMEVRELTLRRGNGSVAVANVNFDLRAGEILALAGVDGNGQSELVQCLAGLLAPDAGCIRMDNLSSDTASWTPAALRHAGLAHVPDDRRGQGIAEALGLTDNMIVSHLLSARFCRGPLLNRNAARTATEAAIADYAIRTTGPDQPIGRLSGGNQQKLVLARELLGNPKVVLAAHPSRGLDVRTIALVQSRLRAARNRGAAVLMVSADLGEIWRLADRVMVFAAGALRGPVRLAETDRRQIGTWMAGHS